MTKAAKDFNAKYGLAVSDTSFKRVDYNEYATQDLGGKIKKNWKESLKRFFTTPLYAISFVVFFAVIILAVVVQKTSAFSAKDLISPADIISSHWIKDLPATGTHVIQTLTTVDMAKLAAHGINEGSGYELINQAGNNFIIKWDPWLYVNAVRADNGLGSLHSIMGTDNSGRDYWTRTWAGTANSLWIAVSIALITTTIGSLLGSWIGMYPGTIYDIIFMKIIALYQSIPSVVWYALILALLDPGPTALFVVLIITGWQRGFGIARMYMWKFVNSGFMESANTMGVSKFKRIVKHALPNYLGMIAYQFVGAIPSIIEATASLAFLGFALNPAAADLGNTLNEVIPLAADTSENLAKILLPAIIIFSITISLHFCAMGVNDALDPRYRKGRG